MPENKFLMRRSPQRVDEQEARGIDREREREKQVVFVIFVPCPRIMALHMKSCRLIVFTV